MAKIDSETYDSSDLAELMDNTGGWAKNWDDVIWYVENVASYDADFAKNEIQPLKKALEKVKQEDKPFTTDYRKLYQEITGDECKDCPPPDDIKSHGINPRDIAEKWLKGLKFPADKQRVVEQMKKNDAPQKALDTVKKIDDQKYKSLGSLLEGVGDVTWDHD